MPYTDLLKRRETRRLRYRTLLARGLCVRCEYDMDMPGGSTCSRCRERRNPLAPRRHHPQA